MNNKSVLVAVSGGVDSSVAAIRLLDAGYDVSGVVFKMSPLHDAAVNAAGACCRDLGIKLYTVDLSKIFKELVIEQFCRQYAHGKTPNPCVVCNPLVKFKYLALTADENNIEYIATGHYANIKKLGDDYMLAKASSLERDQSYMLYRLPQSILSRLIFPLGDSYKPDVRTQAKSRSIASADTPDSQEICFIEGNDYASFIRANGFEGLRGDFVLPNGKRIPHAGVEHYTVGQRRGLGVSYSQPLFVKQILENGDIILAVSGDEFFKSITVADWFLSEHFKSFPEQATVKIRSMAKNVPCSIRSTERGLLCTFDQPQRAPAPGQSAVFYQDDLVIGGGYIDEAFVENK